MQTTAASSEFAEQAHFLRGILLPLPARWHTGMISPEERCALFGLTANRYAGAGKIVDGGCFLGASTACFGLGLRRRGVAPEKIVHSYDLGVIASVNMARLATLARQKKAGPATLAEPEFRKDDPFAELLSELVAPYADHVELRVGDIRTTLHEPDPIEILFLDVCKMADINAVVTRRTFPRLIPGRSIVVHQDYFHDWLPWLHVTMGYFADRFSYLGAAGGSAFFRCEAAITEGEAEFDAWSSLPADEALAAFDRGLPERMEPDQQYLIDIARVILVRKHFGEQRALELMARIVKPDLESTTSNWTLPAKDGVRGWITSPGFG